MDHAPRATSKWGHELQRELGGYYFTARGLLFAAQFVLPSPDGEEFGWLRLDGTSAAELRSKEYVVTFEALGRRYRVVMGGEEVLVAGSKGYSVNELEILCGAQNYEARISLLRNRAVASYPEGGRAVRLSGGLAGRSYETVFAIEDQCTLPIALFLLWHVVANRRRAYRVGGGAM